MRLAAKRRGRLSAPVLASSFVAFPEADEKEALSVFEEASVPAGDDELAFSAVVLFFTVMGV